jgi:hypothetical protein
MERCVGFTVHDSDHWGFIAPYLPQLEYLTLASRLPPPLGLELQPTTKLKSLKIERPEDLLSCPRTILSHLQSELELCFSWFTTPRRELCKIASGATKVPRLHLNIISTPQSSGGLLENVFFHEECIFEQVTHLVLQYADNGLEPVVRHPLEIIQVPKLERLEIWLHHLRTIEGLARVDYLTVTQLIVVMLHVPINPSDEFGLDSEAVLELMQSLPSLELLELTVPLEVLSKVQVGLRERNLCPSLSVIRHH